jgi:hypothetical protein
MAIPFLDFSLFFRFFPLSLCYTSHNYAAIVDRALLTQKMGLLIN